MGFIVDLVETTSNLCDKIKRHLSSSQVPVATTIQSLSDSDSDDEELVAPPLHGLQGMVRGDFRPCMETALPLRTISGALRCNEKDGFKRAHTTAMDLKLDAAGCTDDGDSSIWSSNELDKYYADVMAVPMRRGLRTERPSSSALLSADERATGVPVIIRSYSKLKGATWEEERIRGEIRKLRKAQSCQGIVRLHQVMETEEHIFIIMEAAIGYNLIELVSRDGKLSAARCASEVAQPLLVALVQLHARGIVHQALKPEGVICDSGAVVILSLKEAADMNTESLIHRVGQLEYSAPEILKAPLLQDIFHQVLVQGMDEADLPKHDEKVDVWSVGVMIYEALTGYQPFRGDSVTEVVKAQQDMIKDVEASPSIKPGEPPVPNFLSNSGISHEVVDFLARIFVVDPVKRASAAELLKHPWLLHS